MPIILWFGLRAAEFDSVAVAFRGGPLLVYELCANACYLVESPSESRPAHDVASSRCRHAIHVQDHTRQCRAFFPSSSWGNRSGPSDRIEQTGIVTARQS